ncbi:MAG: hypothetical protein J6A33_05355 [Alphaproteobacteria bacterium]|nr:hypothetical protein [Alphaproteobacteria bacterium]
MKIHELGNGFVAISNFRELVLKHIDEKTLEITDIPVCNSKDIVIPGDEHSSTIYATEYQNKIFCYYSEGGGLWKVRVFAKLMCKSSRQAIFMDFEGKNWKIEYYQDDPYLHEQFIRVVPVQ